MINFILIIICFTIAMIIYIKLKKKNEFIKSIKKLHKENLIWDLKGIKERVEESFYKIEESIKIEELDLIVNYVTKDFYVRQIEIMNWCRIKGEKRILKNVNLNSIEFIVLEEFKDIRECSITFKIEFFAEEKSFNLLEEQSSGEERENKKKFIEYWTFKNKDNCWLVDEILKIDQYKEKKHIKSETLKLDI